MKKSELLAPAGNLEKLKTVLQYGADGAYLGGKMFNLRALSDNFTDRELEDAVSYAHSLNKKLYVTLNIIPHNYELEQMPEYVKYLEKTGIDGVIVSDLGTFEVVKENSNLNINVSTQASNTNWRSVRMWQKLGAKRVILARELSLKEIQEIRDKVPDVELEVFVHGAMCVSISGRCLLSNYLTGRDANRGECAQPCRWKYHLVEEKRPGEYMEIAEDEHGTYIMNTKDLCTIEFIDKILDIGLDSLKIEGRMKSIYYGAVVTRIYREAMDKYYSGTYSYEPKWLEELYSVSNRGFTSGFYYQKPGPESHNYASSSYQQTREMVAKIEKKSENNEYIIEIRNKVFMNQDIEILIPGKESIYIKMPLMINENTGAMMEFANPNMKIRVKIDHDLPEGSIIRIKK